MSPLRPSDPARALSLLGHEARTPLTSIRMALHLLLEAKIGPLTPDQRELLLAAREDCERLLTMMQAVLELARFESGAVALKPSPTPATALLAQADERQGAPPLRIAPVPPDFPLVQADAAHVARLLRHFIGQAEKIATPGEPMMLRAELGAPGFARLALRIHCTQPPTEAEQASLFEPFWRSGIKGSADGDNGLALAICREIALAHGGHAGVAVTGQSMDWYVDLRTSAALPQA